MLLILLYTRPIIVTHGHTRSNYYRTNTEGRRYLEYRLDLSGSERTMIPDPDIARGEAGLETAGTILGHLNNGCMRLRTVLPRRIGVESRN
jgi:hypothetical protein